MSDESGRAIQHGLIFLKCHGCKAPTLFRLHIRHEEDSTEFFASTHCASCEEEEPLQALMVRSLEPALVAKQQVETPLGVMDGCADANPATEGDCAGANGGEDGGE